MQATLSISALNSGSAKLSCHRSHCVTSELAASDLALESSFLHLHLPLHSPQLSYSHLMLKTHSNLQTLATGDTHLAYHPGCSWPKAQIPVSPPVGIPAGESLGGGRLGLSSTSVSPGIKNSRRAYHRASAPHALAITVSSSSRKRRTRREREGGRGGGVQSHLTEEQGEAQSI